MFQESSKSASGFLQIKYIQRKNGFIYNLGPNWDTALPSLFPAFRVAVLQFIEKRKETLHKHVTGNAGVPYCGCQPIPGKVGFRLQVLNFSS